MSRPERPKGTEHTSKLDSKSNRIDRKLARLLLFSFPSIHFLGLATVANFVGVILTVTALLIFKKVFQEALEEIPKLPYELFPGGGGATTPLVGQFPVRLDEATR